VYGHFGPRTLRTQDISALVPKCPMDISAPTKKFETLRHLGQFGTTITLYDEKSDYVNFIPFR